MVRQDKPSAKPPAADDEPASTSSPSSSSSSSNPLGLAESDYRCPYRVLGVERDASAAEIKAAYKRRALQTHPDRGTQSDAQVREMHFKLVSEAYELLSDTAKRTSYDVNGRCSSVGSSFSSPTPEWYDYAAREAASYQPKSNHTFFGTSPEDGSQFAFSWEAPWETARRARASAFAQRGFRPFPVPGGGFGGFGFGFGFQGAADPFAMFNNTFGTSDGATAAAAAMGAREAGGGGARFARVPSVFDDDHPLWAGGAAMDGFDSPPTAPPARRDPFAGMFRMPDIFDALARRVEVDAAAAAANAHNHARHRAPASTMTSSSSSSSSTMRGGGGGGWAHTESHSTTTRVVNGVKETVSRSVVNGQETVKIETPGGSTTYVDGRLVERTNATAPIEHHDDERMRRLSGSRI